MTGSVSRMAVLIGSDNMTSDHVPGANIDINAIEQFLLSPNGGSWTSEEIFQYPEPTQEEIHDIFTDSEIDPDYMFVYFAGHGAHDPNTGKTLLCFNDEELVPIDILYGMAMKQLIIIDACRTPVQVELIKAASRGFGLLAETGDPFYAMSCRNLFDRYLSMSEYGLTIVHSCGIGQEAGASDNGGGIFTQMLISASRAWLSAVEHGSQSVLTIRKAFGSVKQGMGLEPRLRRQVPELEEGRRIYSFPLAVAP